MTKELKGPCWESRVVEDPDAYKTWVCGYHNEKFNTIKEFEQHLAEHCQIVEREGEGG